MLNNLVGKKVIIISSDFIERDLSATITNISQDERCLLLKMDVPLASKGIVYPYAITATRLEGDSYEMLIRDGMIGCSITWVSEDRMDISNPFDLSWWRGGASAITSIYLAKNG